MGWVTLNANFRGKGASPTNDFWHQKTLSPWAIVWWKKLPKISTGWVGCTNVTDNRQTDRRQTELRSHIANVTWVSEWVSKFIHSALKAERVTSALQPRQTKMSLKDVWTVRWRLLKTTCPNFTKLSAYVKVAVARSFSDNSTIRYVLPVLLMTSCFVRVRHVAAPTGKKSVGHWILLCVRCSWSFINAEMNSCLRRTGWEDDGSSDWCVWVRDSDMLLLLL